MTPSTANTKEWIDDFFTKSGPKPVALNDLRRHPRFYYRSCAEVVIYPIVGQKKPTRAFVLTQDLSRSGFSIVHATQLYPGQRIEASFDGRPARAAVVTWCRRLPDKHYSIGCQFTDSV